MTDPSNVLIRFEKVTKAFNGQAVLKNLDLDIRRGQTTVIIGPSGCGKTVLLKHITVLLRPDSGRVYFDQTPISGLQERQLVPFRRRMGVLFQGGALFDSMTVAQNIYFPLQEHGIRDPRELGERCQRVLRLVGMDGAQQKMPEELSGGQKKRVALARAIALNPELLLYDEPTTGLDPVRADLIDELIRRLHRELKITSVVVTHDMGSTRKVADRVIMLHQGVIVADTPPDGLDRVDDDFVRRFIHGRATDEELAELAGGSLSAGRRIT
jgi:phospholipid/cholesterol/gamma-HCH transport system ATP-binding protein